MKKVKSDDKLDEMNPKKRKVSLTIQTPNYLFPCEICKTLTDCRLCSGNHVYCSNTCLSVLYLKLLNNTTYESFDESDKIQK